MKRIIALGLTLIVAAAAIQLLPLSGGTSGAATVDVALQDNAFNPAAITINVGDTVNWDWAGSSNPHSVTSDDGTTFESGGSHSAPFTFSHTFNAAGTFGYHCTVHGSAGQGMFGTITVAQQPATSTPAAGATNTPAAAASSTPVAGGTTAAGAATPTTAVGLPGTGVGDDGGIGWLTWTSIALASMGALTLIGATAQRRRS